MQPHAPDAADLKDLIVVLATAGIVVPLCRFLKIPQIIAFLAAGFAVGPTGLGALAGAIPALSWITIPDRERIALVAEFGVVFLLFTIGLELSFGRIWSMRRWVFGLGASQILATAALIGGTLVYLGSAARPAIVLGLVLALSSTAIVVQILMSQHRLAAEEGRTAFAVLLFQDLMVVPILVVVGVFGRGGDDLLWELGSALVRAAVAVAVIVGLGRFVLRPLFRLAASAASRELFMAMTLLAVLTTALATSLAGLSMPLGAFLAGLLLSESEFRHQVEVEVEPFKGLLLGIFFMSVGMSLAPSYLADHAIAVLGLVAVLVGVKAAIAFALARAFGADARVSLETAILLAQGSEFAFVALGLAAGSGLIEPETVQIVTAVVILSMIATPFMVALGRGAAKRLAAGALPAPEDEDLPAAPVVIGGFGRVGRILATMFQAEGVPYVAVDHDPDCVASARAAGFAVVYGDATHPDMLRRIGGENARAFVVTVGEARAAVRMAEAVARSWPETPIFARARDRNHAAQLRAHGVDEIVPEALAGALHLARRIFEELGFPDSAIETRVDEVRARERVGEDDEETAGMPA